MALSAFEDKDSPPGDRALGQMLGRTEKLWARLKETLQATYGPLAEEWYFAGTSYGWSFRLKMNKRTIVHMTPCRSFFLASLALGEKACAAARAKGLPPPVLAIVEAAPRYAEGRGVRIPVRNRKDLEGVEMLVAVKVAT